MTDSIVYIHDNGRIACADHGGTYLRSSVENLGHAPVIWTPLGTWVAIEPAEWIDATIDGVDPALLACETCAADRETLDKFFERQALRQRGDR